MGVMLDMLIGGRSDIPMFSDNNSSHLTRTHISQNSVIMMHQHHQYPVANDAYIDIVINFTPNDLVEIAVNNLYKNIFENLLLIESDQQPDDFFTQDSFLKLYKETHNTDFSGLVSDISQDSIVRLVQGLIKWSVWDIEHTDQQFTLPGTDPKTLYINYSDIFTPVGTSWRALHQLCKFTRRSASPNMQAAWATYVSNRNNLIDNKLLWLYNIDYSFEGY